MTLTELNHSTFMHTEVICRWLNAILRQRPLRLSTPGRILHHARAASERARLFGRRTPSWRRISLYFWRELSLPPVKENGGFPGARPRVKHKQQGP